MDQPSLYPLNSQNVSTEKYLADKARRDRIKEQYMRMSEEEDRRMRSERPSTIPFEFSDDGVARATDMHFMEVALNRGDDNAEGADLDGRPVSVTLQGALPGSMPSMEKPSALTGDVMAGDVYKTRWIRWLSLMMSGFSFVQVITMTLLWILLVDNFKYDVRMWWPWFSSGESAQLRTATTDFPILTLPITCFAYAGMMYLMQFWQPEQLVLVCKREQGNAMRRVIELTEPLVVVAVAMMAGERTILTTVFLAFSSALVQALGYMTESAATARNRKVFWLGTMIMFLVTIVGPILAQFIHTAVTSSMSSVSILLVVFGLLFLIGRRLVLTWHVYSRTISNKEEGSVTDRLSRIGMERRVYFENLYIVIDALLLSTVGWFLFGALFNKADQAGM